jgi:AhpD family alkylhydroperoxidase
MKKRINLRETEPEAVKVLAGIDKYLQTSNLNPIHKELIKIRASQINGCSYCVDLHTRDARKLGETEQRICLLSVWKETDLFSEEERSILALTEEITLISQGGVSEETYQCAAQLFDANYLGQLIMAIIGINAWNRVGVSTGMRPVKD